MVYRPSFRTRCAKNFRLDYIQIANERYDPRVKHTFSLLRAARRGHVPRRHDAVRELVLVPAVLEIDRLRDLILDRPKLLDAVRGVIRGVLRVDALLQLFERPEVSAVAASIDSNLRHVVAYHATDALLEFRDFRRSG